MPGLFAGNAHPKDRAKQNRAWLADVVAPTLHAERAHFITPIGTETGSSAALPQDPRQQPRNSPGSTAETRKGLLLVIASLLIAVQGILCLACYCVHYTLASVQSNHWISAGSSPTLADRSVYTFCRCGYCFWQGCHGTGLGWQSCARWVSKAAVRLSSLPCMAGACSIAARLSWTYWGMPPCPQWCASLPTK